MPSYQWYLGMKIDQLPKYIQSVLSKQCVHALYPLFDCHEMLLRADQSLMVTNSNACSPNSSCLYSSQTRTPSSNHNCKSLSTDGLRYTSMSLPGCKLCQNSSLSFILATSTHESTPCQMISFFEYCFTF